jgi:hypothetical protein
MANARIFWVGGLQVPILVLFKSLSLPEISVLMPTYNYASYLPEAIASVLAQEFRNFELLIVDDCSSDNTAAVVKPFCARDARVQFASNPANLGMVNNWQKCLEQARGRHIKFLFGDDKLPDPGALGKLLALLQNNPSATLAASARTILDEKSNVIEIVRPLTDGCHNGRKIIADCLNENANLIGEPSAVMFRKKDAGSGFDPKYRQIVDSPVGVRGLGLHPRSPLLLSSARPTAERPQRRQRTDAAGTCPFLRQLRYKAMASGQIKIFRPLCPSPNWPKKPGCIRP